MKIRTLAFVGLLAMSVSGPAKASFFTAEDILSDCESESGRLIDNCVMYLAGIADAHQAFVSWGYLTIGKFCIPKSVNQIQLQKIFVKFANDNPQALHYEAGGVVMNAFKDAFPCK